MALRVSPAMALCLLLLSLTAVAHGVVALKAIPDGVGREHLPSIEEDSALLTVYDPSGEDTAVPGEVVVTEEGEVHAPVESQDVVKSVAEPDPDRSNPDSDGVGHEMTEEQIDIDGDEDEEEHEEMAKEDVKRIKQHGGEGKWKEEERKTKKHHRSHDAEEEEEEEEMEKKKVHRRYRVEKEKTKKRPCHDKSRNDDSDDEDERQEKEMRWSWRKKAIGASRSMFGHGRRSQREEAATEEVKN